MSVYLTPISDLLDKFKDAKPPKFIWKGIQEGNFGYIYGEPKCGKTTLCECLGLSIASGAKSFLGFPLEIKNRKVLMVSLEESDYYRTFRNRKQIEYLTRGQEVDWLDNYQLATDEFPKMITKSSHWKMLNDLIHESKAGTVIIDSLSKIHTGPIEDSSNAIKLTHRLRSISRVHGVTLIMVHHTIKNSKDRDEMFTMAGSRVLSQECDFLIQLKKEGNLSWMQDYGIRYAPLNQEKTYYKINEYQWVQTDQEAMKFSLEDVGDLRKSSVNRDAVWIALNKAQDEDENGEIHTLALKQNLAALTQMSSPTMYDYIKEFIAKDKLIRIANGVYKIDRSLIVIRGRKPIVQA